MVEGYADGWRAPREPLEATFLGLGEATLEKMGNFHTKTSVEKMIQTCVSMCFFFPGNLEIFWGWGCMEKNWEAF